MTLTEATNYAITLAQNHQRGYAVYLATSHDGEHYNYCSLNTWEQQKKVTPRLRRVVDSQGNITHDFAY